MRSGLRIRNEKNVDPEVKRACKEFACWLRKQYDFPIRITFYIKSEPFIRAKDGECVSATCILPFSKEHEPYAKISTGDFKINKKKLERIMR